MLESSQDRYVIKIISPKKISENDVKNIGFIISFLLIYVANVNKIDFKYLICKKIELSYCLKIILIAVAPVFAGFIIYLSWRSTDIEILKQLLSGQLNEIILDFRQTFSPIKNLIPEWTLYSLPDGLWAFSYSFLITFMWLEDKTLLRPIWIASIPVLIIGFEVAQYFNPSFGTFDLIDIFFSLAGIITGLLTGLYMIKVKSIIYVSKTTEIT